MTLFVPKWVQTDLDFLNWQIRTLLIWWNIPVILLAEDRSFRHQSAKEAPRALIRSLLPVFSSSVFAIFVRRALEGRALHSTPGLLTQGPRPDVCLLPSVARDVGKSAMQRCFKYYPTHIPVPVWEEVFSKTTVNIVILLRCLNIYSMFVY